MSVTLSPGARNRFRNDLSGHRASHGLADAIYAERILGVSLNTLKRCLSQDIAPLGLKPQTFLAICRGADLDPRTYGVDLPVPNRGKPWGGYRRQDYATLEGAYLLHRRSFLTAENVIRGVLIINWSETEHCFEFTEHQSYETDAGVPYETVHRGQVAIRANRGMLSFFSVSDGDARLTIVTMPEGLKDPSSKARLRARGVMLTYGNPRDFYQPIVSAVVIENVATSAPVNVALLCKTLRPGSDEFSVASAELRRAEDNAVVMTPLMFRQRAGG